MKPEGPLADLGRCTRDSGLPRWKTRQVSRRAAPAPPLNNVPLLPSSVRKAQRFKLGFQRISLAALQLHAIEPNTLQAMTF